ncbi:MAG TPA: energy transducer TonB [Vicinamibacteria bacterium]|jgi:protein TonB
MSEELSSRRAEDFLRLDYQAPSWEWKRNRRSFALSFLVHATIVLALSLPFIWDFLTGGPVQSVVRVRYYVSGEGEGGGGGGGSGGRKPTAFIRDQPQPTEEAPQPRRAPIAPRQPRPLRADALKAPDLPSDASAFFDQPLSPDARDFPGLDLDDMTDYGGVDREASSGSGGGIGGGEGTGQGTGTGWGSGPGRGGGYGGGIGPGSYDIEPIPIFSPKPAYPPEAREKLVRGGVILEILVREDGTTEVLQVLKSLPYGCVEVAIEAAERWRFKPALKAGKPVEAKGIITVEFELSVRNQG